MAAHNPALPFAGGPATLARALGNGAVQSIRLGGVWIHRAAARDTTPATFPLQPGESVRIAQRWYHGPKIGDER